MRKPYQLSPRSRTTAGAGTGVESEEESVDVEEPVEDDDEEEELDPDSIPEDLLSLEYVSESAPCLDFPSVESSLDLA